MSPRNVSWVMNLPMVGSRYLALAKKRSVSLSQMYPVKEKRFLEAWSSSGNRKLPQTVQSDVIPSYQTASSPDAVLDLAARGTGHEGSGRSPKPLTRFFAYARRRRRGSGGAPFRLRRIPRVSQG